MSKENLEQFMSKVADSDQLMAKIGEEIDAEALIALGAECGCEFTAEEFQEYAESKDDEYGIIYFSDPNCRPYFENKRMLMKADETVWIDIDSLIIAYIESFIPFKHYNVSISFIPTPY